MKKIPTLFERDWEGDRSRVTKQIHAGCQWVSRGEGVATRKIDGTSCLVRDGRLFKRRELRKGESAPTGFELADYDEETCKTIGWVPVGDGPEDRWHREAFGRGIYQDGSYELVGPKIQGNPEGEMEHRLIRHGADIAGPIDAPRDFDGLRDYLTAHNIEGVVFHHPDGLMAKIKARDFGIKRGIVPHPNRQSDAGEG